ncbi:transmembrane protein, putative [Medicago truncatula]|uniref:Transmembrane protein, putative n=1 Tax=Medicago truncatula TaxID=3880 RepID=A0A072TM76_MEDTR|nr:transmembrane protein, putative [Medicago truncatula]
MLFKGIIGIMKNYHFSHRYHSKPITKPTCAVCVLLVALLSTLTAVIVFMVWSIGIFTVVVQRWDDLVHQMKALLPCRHLQS